MTLRTPTLLALVAATAAAGCGSSSTSPLSKSELVAKGDAICKRVNDGIRNVGPTNTAADVAKVAPKVYALEQQGVNDLRKLTPPGAVASDYTSFLDKTQVLTDDANKIGAAAKTNDKKTAQTIASEAASASASATSSASKLGFKDCAHQN
ncbi:MAG: hypothetical protein ACR2ND_05480 [Solirubrobacteraceae bacterium]